MKKSTIIGILVAAVIYLMLYPFAAAAGLIHPVCYAYVGTIVPILFSFVYLYVCAKMKCFGAAAFLNAFVLIIGTLVGEGNLAFYIIMVIVAAFAELARKVFGYDTKKGVRFSFIPFAYSFYAYSAHWWANTEDSLQAAVDEMPEGYAEMMEPVIANIPALVIALISVIPVALLGMWIAEKVMKKQVESFR